MWVLLRSQLEFLIAVNVKRGLLVKRTRYKMVAYRCFVCNKEIESTTLRKRVRCIYCGSKMLFKQRTTTTKVLAV